MDGYYSLPAGHLNGGESLIKALIRETKEEINVNIKKENIELVHISNNLQSNPERIDFFFICKIWEGRVVINEKDKCDDIKWLTLNEMEANTIEIVKIALNKIDKNNNYSEHF